MKTNSSKWVAYANSNCFKKNFCFCLSWITKHSPYAGHVAGTGADSGLGTEKQSDGHGGLPRAPAQPGVQSHLPSGGLRGRLHGPLQALPRGGDGPGHGHVLVHAIK